MTTTKRISGRALQALRLRIWSANPCCAMCGRLTVMLYDHPDAFELDHITALTNQGTNEDTNLQILCRLPCHELKTAADLGYTPAQAIGLDGFPIEQPQHRASTARWKRASQGKAVQRKG